MEENILEVKNLNFLSVFTNFNINFPRNKFITISGSNNCGKTTLIKILSRRIPTNDTVKLCGEGLEHFQIDELNHFLRAIIPEEINFTYNSIFLELLSELSNLNIDYKTSEKRIKDYISEYKLTSYKETLPNELPYFIKLKLELIKVLIRRPNVLLLDNVLYALSDKEKKEILEILSTAKKSMTIILTTSSLTETLSSDYLYIINESVIILEGEPLSVLVKDNILNRIGLEVPFMIDLSVKLQDYNLLTTTELDMERMVEELWK